MEQEQLNIYQRLFNIQQQLKAPKGQYNSFGKYNYRSCEDILEAVKPLLLSNGLVLTLVDDVIPTSNGNYIKATATLTCTNDGTSVSATALAREEVTKKGMDAPQMTGTSSSYARKYALNGLFAIDDTKDNDSNEYRNQVNELNKLDQAPKGTNNYEKEVLKQYPPKQGVELDEHGLPKSKMLMSVQTFKDLCEICKANDSWYSKECEKLKLDRKKTKEFTQEQADTIINDYYIYRDKQRQFASI